MQQTWVQSLGQEDPVEEEMVTHSSILTWGIPQTEKAFGLYSPWGHKKLNMTEWLNNNNNNKNHCEGKRREIVPARTARPTAGKLPPLRTSPEILSKKNSSLSSQGSYTAWSEWVSTDQNQSQEATISTASIRTASLIHTGALLEQHLLSLRKSWPEEKQSKGQGKGLCSISAFYILHKCL